MTTSLLIVDRPKSTSSLRAAALPSPAGVTSSKSAAAIALSRLATTAFSGSWYHEEAIQEAERARKI